MNKFKIIRLSIAVALTAGAITFGIIGGRKVAATTQYADEVNECTRKIDELMNKDTKYDYNTVGTENYKQIKAWEAERKEAEEKYNENEKNLALFSSLGFVCIFALIYVGVDSLRVR